MSYGAMQGQPHKASDKGLVNKLIQTLNVISTAVAN
jgi:hypothetical protein